MRQDCNTCKDYGNCGCDDLMERAYLHREGKDCYNPNIKENQKNTKTPSYSEIYEAEDAWERRVSSYRCH